MKIFKKNLQGILPIINIRKGHNYNTIKKENSSLNLKIRMYVYQ
jgi:hypothetical protein